MLLYDFTSLDRGLELFGLVGVAEGLGFSGHVWHGV